MLESYNVILKGLYPELSPREINTISQVITNKLSKYKEDLRKVELYNQPYVIRGADQKFGKVEVFGRTVHLRLTFK